MGQALVLNTASKANTTGGTFADSLTANTNDSLAVANYGGSPDVSGARVLEAWGIDSDSVAELEWIYSRPQSTHDQNHGFRVNIPSLIPGGAANVAAHNILPGYGTIDLYKSDTAALTVTSTASDDVLVSWQTLYDDLPGASGVFSNWAQVQALQKSIVGIQCNAVASGTPGAYGASRAFNTDDDRLHANTWYALLGASLSTAVTTVALIGPDWGGQRIGLPAGVLDMRSDMWFVDMAVKWQTQGYPNLIPCFNSNNKGNILVNVADGEASTAPKLDFTLYELTGQPGF